MDGGGFNFAANRFPAEVVVTAKGGATRDLDVLVLEIAIGLDRCLYNWAAADEL